MVTAENLAVNSPGSAQVLENWRPTQTGIVLRGGSPKHATIDAGATEPVRSLMPYIGGSTRKLFASDATNIFDITNPADAVTPPTADVTGQTSGVYSFQNFATSGGNYMLCLNSDDELQLYDGTTWYTISSTDLYELKYDAETSNFTVGAILTGGTSAASATIVKIVDDGTTGTLHINAVTGTFQDNETITDNATGAGSATANGTATLLFTAITGLATSSLSHVSVYRNRLFFVEGNTMNVHYLPTDSITGALSNITLAGTFKEGGAVAFTATWSLDAGDGLDDKLVVISTEGEVAVFEGSNPSDAASWGLVGVYTIPEPLGPQAIMKAGGDLIIGTVGGMVPISAAINKDPAALSVSAISRMIEPDWVTEAVGRREIPWWIAKWSDKNSAYVTLPVPNDSYTDGCFVVNLETGAWARYTGWDTRCMVVHDNKLYFGTNTGTIHIGEQTGYDGDSTSYLAKYVGGWDHLGSVDAVKSVRQVRAVFRTSNTFLPQLSGSVDYSVSLPSAPDAVALEPANSLWGSALWGVSLWGVGAELTTYNTRWTSIGKTGFVFAPQIQVTVAGDNTPTAELATFTVSFERGGVIV